LSSIKEFLKNKSKLDVKDGCRFIRKLISKNYLVKTGDSTYTAYSTKFSGKKELMHSQIGGIVEAEKKFVLPCMHYFPKVKNLKILDICTGFGYNAIAAIDYCLKHNINLDITLIDASPEVIISSIFLPFPKDSISKKIYHAYLSKELEKHSLSIKGVFDIYDPNINLKLIIDDFRHILRKRLLKNQFDIIFLDAFSPNIAPEFYTVEVFTAIKKLMSKQSILATFTASSATQASVVEAGLILGKGPIVGRKRPGTLVSNTFQLPRIGPDDELLIGLTDLGIPLRDKNLLTPPKKILENRKICRKQYRGKSIFSSSKRCVLFLDKSPLTMKKRILRDISQLGVRPCTKDAYFLICPVKDRCICGNNCRRKLDSTAIILELRQRLYIYQKMQ
jgi:tRNA U34 5-methylaminomethyl-2-thiouridine-forming methyltransferase MnmC